MSVWCRILCFLGIHCPVLWAKPGDIFDSLLGKFVIDRPLYYCLYCKKDIESTEASK